MTEIYRGLDLGAYHCVGASAVATDAQNISVDVNALANRSTPSVVSIEGKQRLCGEAAEGRTNANPTQTFNYLTPALLVKDADDLKSVKERFQWFWTLDGAEFDEKPLDELKSVAQVYGVLLKRMVYVEGKLPNMAAGQRQLALALPDFVDTSSFEAPAVRALLDAVRVAGLDMSRTELALHSECLAVQWATKYKETFLAGEMPSDEVEVDGAKAKVTTCLIVDVGYSQSTASLVTVTPVAEEKKAETDGAEGEGEEKKEGEEAAAPSKLRVEVVKKKCVSVGVYDFVHALTVSGLEHAKTKFGEEVAIDSKRGWKLKSAMQKALKELSMLPDTNVGLECWLTDDSKDFTMDLKRIDLENSTQYVVEKVEEAISEVLGSGDNADAVKPHYYEIVGGGVRIPCVARKIAKTIGLLDGVTDDKEIQEVVATKLSRGLDGSSGVATGACLKAAASDKEFSGSIIELVNPAFPSTIAEDITKEENDSEALKAMVALESSMSEVETKELGRLDAQNKFESYIYEAKNQVGSNKFDFEDHEDVQKHLDDMENWFYDHVEDTSIDTDAWVKKFDETVAYIKEKGAAFFAKEEEKKAAMEAELSAAHAEEQKRKADAIANGEADDHDNRVLPKSERLKKAEKQRVEGNELFKAQTYSQAIVAYQKAQGHLSKLFDMNAEETAEKDRIALSCYLNTAMCYLKAAEKETDRESAKGKEKIESLNKKVDAACDKALEIDPKNIKGLFRKATALEGMGSGKLDDARKTCKIGLEAEPDNAQLLQLDKKLERSQLIEKKKAAKMYGKMFG